MSTGRDGIPAAQAKDLRLQTMVDLLVAAGFSLRVARRGRW